MIFFLAVITELAFLSSFDGWIALSPLAFSFGVWMTLRVRGGWIALPLLGFILQGTGLAVDDRLWIAYAAAALVVWLVSKRLMMGRTFYATLAGGACAYLTYAFVRSGELIMAWIVDPIRVDWHRFLEISLLQLFLLLVLLSFFSFVRPRGAQVNHVA